MGAACHGFAQPDKVYHPYVEAFKTEIEFRGLYQLDGDDERLDGKQSYYLALGRGFNERLFLEGYVIGKKRSGESLSVDGFELEALLQLTEQGEYWSDWGLLWELEREIDEGIWEVSLALLWEKEWGRWVTAANLFAAYEFGPKINNEFETEFKGQLKYRLSRLFEPAVELYMDENTRGIGPVLLGAPKLGRNKLKWELGLIFGFNRATADQNIRFLLEYEF